MNDAMHTDTIRFLREMQADAAKAAAAARALGDAGRDFAATAQANAANCAAWTRFWTQAARGPGFTVHHLNAMLEDHAAVASSASANIRAAARIA
jgi:hypothetical protein